MSRSTDSPPTPESKMPTGWLLTTTKTRFPSRSTYAQA
jgi:hypothetical protein